MKKLILSKAQKRFLLIWVVFHLFGLTANLVPIKGEIGEDRGAVSYIFTPADESNRFWPFVSFVEPYAHGFTGEKTYHFMGIFYEYDISEFLVYVLGAIVIILVPKLW